MIASEHLDEIKKFASSYNDLGVPHEGDCLGSLCEGCGHCLHSVEKCDHDCEYGGGCSGAIDDDEVQMKRAVLATVDALQRILDLADSVDATTGSFRSIVHTASLRDIINDALKDVTL